MSNTQNAVSVFNFENQQFDVLTDEQGNFWFIGSQICNILSYANAPDALAKHVDEEDKKTLSRAEFLTIANRDSHSGRGGAQFITIINESGLYSLCLKSQLPSAKKFKRWVTSEVLPSIRKTGKYEAPPKINSDNSFFIAGLHGYIDNDGKAYFNAKTVALQLGISKLYRDKNNITCVRWVRFAQKLRQVGYNPPEDLNEATFIPEEIFHRLVRYLRNDTARQFRYTIKNVLLPELQKIPEYRPSVPIEQTLEQLEDTKRTYKKVESLEKIIKDITSAAKAIEQGFNSSYGKSLTKAITLKSQITGYNLESLIDLIPSDDESDDW